MSISSARVAAIDPLMAAAERFPDLGPPRLSLQGLSAADAALATAIYRTTVERWMTLEHLLDRVAKRPMQRTDPRVRAVLLAGAAQLLFLRGVTDYAAVDESVMLVRKVDRPNAAGAVNAVLRKVAKMVGERRDEPWRPARDTLPLPDGTLTLTSPLLPKTDNLLSHLAVATSRPLELVTRWHKQFGPQRTLALCVHDLREPPTFVVDEAGTQSRWINPWSELTEWLAGDPRRRVQDPTSVGVVEAAAHLRPRRVLDYCAGLGTKTRQIAATWPDARMIATDTHSDRFATLRELEAAFPNVRTPPPEVVEREVHRTVPETGEPGLFDLILLDLPCSNSGVLARRVEAKYRLTATTLEELAALQQSIVARVMPWLAPGGTLLYATCSIEPVENERQVAWAAERFGLTLDRQALTLPHSDATTYHDGGYHALLRRPADRAQ